MSEKEEIVTICFCNENHGTDTKKLDSTKIQIDEIAVLTTNG